MSSDYINDSSSSSDNVLNDDDDDNDKYDMTVISIKQWWIG